MFKEGLPLRKQPHTLRCPLEQRHAEFVLEVANLSQAREVPQDGDIVNVDVTTLLDGFHCDTSATFIIGRASEEATRLVEVARACRDAGITVVREGARLGDVGAAIDALARSQRHERGHRLRRARDRPQHALRSASLSPGAAARASGCEPAWRSPSSR